MSARKYTVSVQEGMSSWAEHHATRKAAIARGLGIIRHASTPAHVAVYADSEDPIRYWVKKGGSEGKVRRRKEMEVGAYPKLAGKIRLRRVKLDRGGYDAAGQYWGTGAPLWSATDEDGGDDHVRAYTRDDAFAKIAKEHPGVSLGRKTRIRVSGDEERSGIFSSPDTGRGLAFNTRIWREGTHLKMTLQTLAEGSPRFFNASVDLVPIAKALHACHHLAKGSCTDEQINGHLAVAGISRGDIVGWNPFKSVARAVRKIGRSKLLKEISRKVKAVTTSPAFVTVAKVALITGGPVTMALGAGMQATALAANVAKQDGNILKGVLRAAQQQIRSNDPDELRKAIMPILPASVRPMADEITSRVMTEVKRAMPPLAMASATSKQLNKVLATSLKKGLPEAAKEAVVQVARRAVKADQVLAELSSKILPTVLPESTSLLLSQVSDDAVGTFAAAQNAIAALEQRRALKRSDQSPVANQLTPDVIAKVMKRADLAERLVKGILHGLQSEDPIMRAEARKSARIMKIAAQARKDIRNYGREASARMSSTSTFNVAGSRSPIPRNSICVAGQIIEVGCGADRNCGCCH